MCRLNIPLVLPLIAKHVFVLLSVLAFSELRCIKCCMLQKSKSHLFQLSNLAGLGKLVNELTEEKSQPILEHTSWGK